MTLLIANTATHRLSLGGLSWPLAIGRTGACPVADKREGDGKTPLGHYRLETLYRRAGRGPKCEPRLPVHVINPHDGWCDAPGHRAYNRRITLPSDASHEKLWRDDHAYDGLIVLSHNRWPVVPGYGSAIFLHIARFEDGAMVPTEGCLALEHSHFWALVGALPPRAHIWIR